MRIRFLFLGLLVVASALPCLAQGFVTESLRIPMQAAGAEGLEALLVKPDGKGPFPLALINHGSPREATDRPGMTPQQMLPQMLEFARRGFAAVSVMRRGYGASGGGWAETYGACAAPDYVSAGRAAAADLKATIAALAQRPDLDTRRTLAVGVSAGGYAVVALTEDPPPGLVAGISFAGARGSTSADTVCGTSALIDAFRVFGMRARVPMMWVFAENDHFFGPALAAQLREAYVAHGARVDFRRVGAFGVDGHTLFSAAGRPIWTPLVDGFLEERKLQATERLLPLPAPANLRPPRQLNASGRKEFEAYLEAPPHKAFALSAHGGYGYRTARRSDADARAQALAACEQARHAACQIYAVDDDYAR